MTPRHPARSPHARSREARRRLPIALILAACVAAPLHPAASARTTAPSTEPAARTAAPAAELWAPRSVAVQSYDGEVYDSLGISLIAGDEPVEVISKRPGWGSPIVTTIRSAAGETRLPEGTMKRFGGLPSLVTLTVTDPRGRTVARKRISGCLNGEGARARPDAPARSPYPWDCAAGAFVKGSVMGVQAGWRSPLDGAGEAGWRLEPGRYRVSASMPGLYGRALGIAAADRSVSTVLTVTAWDDDEHEGHAHRRSRTADATPAAPGARPRTAGTGAPPDGPVPDLQSIPAFGIEAHGNHLRFSATVWNAGDSPLVVDGFRRDGEDVMDAYQYYFDRDGEQVGYDRVGEMIFHHAPSHNHWHFLDFAQYSLLDAGGEEVVRSTKQSFCLANTDATDYTVPGADWRPDGTDLSTACGDLSSQSLRQTLASGSGDTYTQDRAGQAFSLRGLPNGRYYIAVIANPEGNLVERSTRNNTALRAIRIGGEPGARTVRVGRVGVVD